MNSTSPALVRFVLFVDRLVFFIARHWLWMVSGALFVYIAIPMLAPVLMHSGFPMQAEWIYDLFGLNCHQLAHRSYFFFGDQNVYTIEQLRVALNVHNETIFYWRDFRGNAELGYKAALCERDLAIYGAMVLGGLIFGFLRDKLKPLDWRVYVLFFVLPMAFDGGSQLTGLRESNYILRTITGALFGLGSVWLAYPYVESAMRDLRAQAAAQYARAVNK